MKDYISEKGKKGEEDVYKLLVKLFPNHKIYKNIYLNNNKFKTVEADIILVHESGIYVFESKNYSGWIFGGEWSENWTVTYRGTDGKSNKKQFKNPIIQNYTHITMLKNRLNTKLSKIKSVIVFSNDSEFKDVEVEYSKVYRLSELGDRMKELTSSTLLSDKEMKYFTDVLNTMEQETEKLARDIDNQKDGSKNKNVPTKKEGCYIATAVYGSYESPEVLKLRKFRDNVLKKHMLGRLFIKTYYTISPTLANKLKKYPKINNKVKHILDKFVNKL
jgi:hypothetical protein